MRLTKNYSRKKRVSRKSMRGGRKSLRRRGKSLRRRGGNSLRRRGGKSLRGGATETIKVKPMSAKELQAEYELDEKIKSMSGKELQDASYKHLLSLEETVENAEECETNPDDSGDGILSSEEFIDMITNEKLGKVAKKSWFAVDIRDSKLIDYAKIGTQLPTTHLERNQLIKDTIGEVLDMIITPIAAYKDVIPDGWTMKTGCHMKPVMEKQGDIDAVRDQCGVIKEKLLNEEHNVLFTETNFGWKSAFSSVGRTYLYSPYFFVNDKYYKIIIPDMYSKVSIGKYLSGVYQSNLTFQFIK